MAEPTYTIIDREQVRPSVDEVALLLRTRTMGPRETGLGGDTAPGDLSTFSASTRPTLTEAESIVDQATSAVLAQLPGSMDPSHYGAVKHATALYAAVLIEGSFFREGSDSGAVELWRSMFAETMTRLRDLTNADAAEGARTVDSVVLRSTMADYDPYYPMPPERP